MHGLAGSGPDLGSGLPIHALYGGWIDVVQSAIHDMDYVTENMMAFPGGWVETRQLGWSRPVESVCATTERCYMLNLSLSGRITGGSVRNLHAARRQGAEALGRMWLIPPDQTLQFNSVEGQSRSIRCVLDAGLFERFVADLPRWRCDEEALHAAFHIGGGQIEWLLRRMERELREPDFATGQAIEALAHQLTVEIIRALKLRREESDFRTGSLAPWRLRAIDQRLFSAAPLPNVEELAKLCDLTVRHLSRAFRNETGRTIGKQIEAAMAERAIGMLQGGLSVREVALRLGYATPGSFSVAFHRATGLLAGELAAAGKNGRKIARMTQ